MGDVMSETNKSRRHQPRILPPIRGGTQRPELATVPGSGTAHAYRVCGGLTAEGGRSLGLISNSILRTAVMSVVIIPGGRVYRTGLHVLAARDVGTALGLRPVQPASSPARQFASSPARQLAWALPPQGGHHGGTVTAATRTGNSHLGLRSALYAGVTPPSRYGRMGNLRTPFITCCRVSTASVPLSTELPAATGMGYRLRIFRYRLATCAHRLHSM